jgi:hypothetical protein
MRRVGPALVASAVAVILGLSLPAVASHTDQADPNDTDGRLDVSVVEFDHEARPLQWRIRTYGAWTVPEMWDRGYLVVQLDTKGGPAVDHFVLVRSDGRRLLATLYAIRSDGTEHAIARVRAGKDGARTATVDLALHKLPFGRSRASYFWSVLSTFTGSVCPRTCLDRVPDEGMIEQPLPGVTPTPTPTPSPSPTATPSPTAGA